MFLLRFDVVLPARSMDPNRAMFRLMNKEERSGSG